MKKNNFLFLSIVMLFLIQPVLAQDTKRNDLGAWYMYFFNTKFKESRFGIQGDIQYRSWNLLTDKEQLLLRAGLTYNPKDTNITFTLGAANISTGIIGESTETTNENRIYQELLMPQKVASRFYFTHRFRYEQRYVENQNFRTRIRYNLFLNVPINKKELVKNALYVALYNEVFINGEKNIGNGAQVNFFDRNRFYTGIGYGITDKIRVQMGFMNQTTEAFSKNQLQLSLHHNF